MIGKEWISPRIRDEAGFGMTEVLLGAAVVAGLAMAILAANQIASKSVKTLHQGSASQTLSDRLKALLETPSVCAANFADSANPIRFNIASVATEVIPITRIIINPGATDKIAEIGAVAEEGTRISAMELSGFQELEASRAYSAQLILQQSKTAAGQAFGPNLRKIRIPIFLETTVSGSTATVKRCSASGLPDVGDGMATALKFCDSTGGNWDILTHRCQPPLPPPDQVCASLGGSWNGGVCVPHPPGTCNSFGNPWGWDPPCRHP